MNPSEYKRSNINVWNEVAPRYHRRWARPGTGPFGCTGMMLDMVNARAGNAALDVACGTGAVSGQLSVRVSESGRVVGVDTSPKALRIASRWIGNRPNLDFVNADAETVSFGRKFDIVTCQFGLFFFPNAPKALHNMRESMTDRGRLGIVVHGTKEAVPYHGCIIREAVRFMPDYIPPGSPALDRYSERGPLRDVVEGAGFTDVCIRELTFRYSPGDFDAYWRQYVRYIARPLREKIAALGRRRKAELREAIRRGTVPYTGDDGTLDFPWQVLILTASR